MTDYYTVLRTVNRCLSTVGLRDVLQDHPIIEDLSTENIFKYTKIFKFSHLTKHFFACNMFVLN